MRFTAQQLAYRDTGKFSKIVLDYIDGAETLRPFYAELPTLAGIKNTIEKKRSQPLNRAALVSVLQEQYQLVPAEDGVLKNIDALRSPHTFTVCTAHQPNLFTGPLYFVYKILHAIRLAKNLNEQLPQYQFVPVYYMGSEDADKEELNHTYLQGKKISWETNQTGAVGRMEVDKQVVSLISEMAGQLNIAPFGAEIIAQLQQSYTPGTTMQEATFRLVHGLFKKFGLVVLISDNGVLKKLMQSVFEADLFQQTPSEIVEATGTRLGEYYNIQASPRAINLFYLQNNIRSRLVREGDVFQVHETAIQFTETELQAELQNHPERFSPNVILRGLYQETILPNIAFIGGGGELAYWLQLNDLFAHYAIPFPVLVLRNSFLIIEKKWQERINHWDLSLETLFHSEQAILDAILKKSGRLPHLNGETQQLALVYEDLKKLAAAVDTTLSLHVEALKTKSLKQLTNLEKKLMRAERRKHEALQHQIKQVKEMLFPKNGLQERVENVSSFYAKWGPAFLDDLMQQSLTLEQQFVVLAEV